MVPLLRPEPEHLERFACAASNGVGPIRRFEVPPEGMVGVLLTNPDLFREDSLVGSP